jgi:hypothetical protein
MVRNQLQFFFFTYGCILVYIIQWSNISIQKFGSCISSNLNNITKKEKMLTCVIRVNNVIFENRLHTLIIQNCIRGII